MFSGSGHHVSLYLDAVLDAFNEVGVEYKVALPAAVVDSDSFLVVKGKLESQRIIKYRDFKSGRSLFTTFYNWNLLKEDIGSHVVRENISSIYIPTLDPLARSFEIFGSPFKCEYTALYMSPLRGAKLSRGVFNSLKKIAKKILIWRLLGEECMHTLLFIDPIVHREFTDSWSSRFRGVEYVCDFGNSVKRISREGAAEALGVPKSKKYILVYGSLTARKGVINLVKALDRAKLDNLCLILAGQPDKEISSFLETNTAVNRLRLSGRIETRLQFQSREQEAQLFSVASAVWLGYVGSFDGSSGVLHLSVSAGIPLLAMDRGVIGELVQEYQLGTTVIPENQSSIVSGLQEIEVKCDESLHDEVVENFRKNFSKNSHTSKLLSVLGIK